MSHYLYGLSLFVSLIGLTFFDLKRHRLIIRKSTKVAIPVTVLFLISADVAGITMGIFSTNPAYVSGIFLGSPSMPIEEPLLLLLISYCCVLIAKELE